jgi:hypothetical protein
MVFSELRESLYIVVQAQSSILSSLSCPRPWATLTWPLVFNFLQVDHCNAIHVYILWWCWQQFWIGDHYVYHINGGLRLQCSVDMAFSRLVLWGYLLNAREHLGLHLTCSSRSWLWLLCWQCWSEVFKALTIAARHSVGTSPSGIPLLPFSSSFWFLGFCWLDGFWSLRGSISKFEVPYKIYYEHIESKLKVIISCAHCT